MSAEHDDDGSTGAHRGDDGLDQPAEVTRREHIREPREERGEGRIVLGCVRELGGADLARPPRDRLRANARQVGFRNA
jgi:hypothetical protein